MIDIESEVFITIAEKIQKEYPKVYVTGEYVKTPPQFPCVSIVEIDNRVNRSTRDTSNIEKFAQIFYEVNVYSNKAGGKKTECREIIGFVDEELAKLGFTRTFLNPVPNEWDASIYRIVGRYNSIVSRDKVIYRR